MRILATIPAVRATAWPAADAASRPEPAAAPSHPQTAEGLRERPVPIGRLRQRPKPVFPFASVAALVALAVMAWTLAGWNDARRAGRQEADDRFAERPVAIPTEESVVR